MMKVIIYYLLGLFVFILVTILLFFVIDMVTALIDWGPPYFGEFGDFRTYVYVLISSAVPLLFGFIFSRSMVSVYSRKAHVVKPLLFKRKWVSVLLIGAYLLTWAVGGPAVQSANTRWAIEECKRIHDKTSQGVWKNTPYIETYVTYPILPFIVISYHEYQIAPVYGLGSWDVYCWYLMDVKRLFTFPIWIS